MFFEDSFVDTPTYDTIFQKLFSTIFMIISIDTKNHNHIDIYDCHNNTLFSIIVDKRDYILFYF